ncbi:MAG: TetR/AcrR family transcriptional regulator [Eubacteriales bacterium]|nr:TetR/AcrR family transcriptional regulator [Eubacteriales bacterium]
MDRRIQKTREAIREAYFSLLRSDANANISIAQIARVANIDRKTFYLHYDSIDALIHEYILEQSEQMISCLMENKYFESPFRADLLYEALEASMVQDEELGRHILNSPYAKTFWDELVNIIVNTAKELCADRITCPMKDFEICVRFYAHASVAIYRDFLNNKIAMDVKHLVELTHITAHYGIDYFINDAGEPEKETEI